MKGSQNILVCGTNWIGDGIMSMPAIRLFREKTPSCNLSILVRRSLAALWEMCPDVDDVIPYDRGLAGTIRAGRELKRRSIDSAFIFPNSFRSALIPFLAGIGHRIGTRGHYRALLLTDSVDPDRLVAGGHQSLEYVKILGIDSGRALPPARLHIDECRIEAAAEQFGIDRAVRRVALVPGAARGASKRWPSGHFSSVGRWLVKAGFGVVVVGSAAERELCETITGDIGEGALNLAGRTGLPDLAAVLSMCETAVTNDSGGMHLAAAVGLKVVAVFGLTDPATTGPMGEGHCVISSGEANVSRDIPRNSTRAARCLESIGPDRVMASIDSILGGATV